MMISLFNIYILSHFMVNKKKLSIFYLYKLDHYIVNDLKLKYMVKYMDDYVIFCKDKYYLKYALNIIKDKLEKEYKLKINRKKTLILDSYHGFDFLGYRFKVNNKIIINIKSDNKKRRDNNIKKNNYLYSTNSISYKKYLYSNNLISYKKYLYSNNLISYKKYFNSMNNYNNSYKYVN